MVPDIIERSETYQKLTRHVSHRFDTAVSLTSSQDGRRTDQRAASCYVVCDLLPAPRRDAILKKYTLA
jgi:hypothetical protein